ncbi:hypothetical protein [Streptomyces sp. Root369]|uniref:hypothetical protein n=1 Tax=Streptomyces sp. Root369 TaxID=1736523 RepID=UPI00070DAFCF|nr:hypothetical protein [Streptomyces sp. Root369]KQW13595.1 hypothetical protein ASD08_31010 [Streptomyces sp. Root369]
MKTAVRRQERPHCTCVEVRNYDYDAAAQKLGCKKRFLQDRISRLPHQRLGESVAFCDCDLRIVQRMFTVIPDEIWEQLLNQQPAETPAPTAPRSLHSIKPAGASRPRAAVV